MNRLSLKLSLLLVALLAMTAACGKKEDPEPDAPDPAPEGILVKRVAEAGPALGPDASAFQAASQHAAALIPQLVVVPRNETAAVDALTVRAVHDGNWLSLLLEWRDPTPNNRMGIGEFEDQVAVQVPLKADTHPNIMMGDINNSVVILQWRAGMQKALERGETPNIRHAYPNTAVDIDIVDLLGSEAAKPYLGAAGLGNPVSVPELDMSPVLVHVAAGYGSLTVYPGRHAEGHGMHDGTHWRVAMHIPIRGDNPVAPTLRPGQSSIISFAAWDGDHDEVGSRKAWTPAWIPILLEP
jgi:DMSO reductase family type II enzyme heme b subunit